MRAFYALLLAAGVAAAGCGKKDDGEGGGGGGSTGKEPGRQSVSQRDAAFDTVWAEGLKLADQDDLAEPAKTKAALAKLTPANRKLAEEVMPLTRGPVIQKRVHNALHELDLLEFGCRAARKIGKADPKAKEVIRELYIADTRDKWPRRVVGALEQWGFRNQEQRAVVYDAVIVRKSASGLNEYDRLWIEAMHGSEWLQTH